MKNVEKLFVYSNNSIYEALATIQDGSVEITLVVDEERHLIGTITDGDIRRAILRGTDMGDRVDTLLEGRPHPHQKPTVALVGTPTDVILQIMREKVIQHVPLLDDEGRVVELVWMSELIEDVELPPSAIIMAGGFGSRLLPLTKKLPKPMLPVGGKPLLEHIIEQLREAGIERVNLTTHYKKEVIADYFGDGQEFGLEIRYLEEDQPLGTAGALSLLEAQDEPLLVINGDILSQIDFRAMLGFHKDHKADMTVAVRQYNFDIPFGVIEVDGVNINSISEKPTMSHFINAGIYLLNPEICRFIQKNQPYHMTDLIDRAITEGQKVICFPVYEDWRDVGRPEDYELAQSDAENGKD